MADDNEDLEKEGVEITGSSRVSPDIEDALPDAVDGDTDDETGLDDPITDENDELDSKELDLPYTDENDML